jgi:hypothetical protein
MNRARISLVECGTVVLPCSKEIRSISISVQFSCYLFPEQYAPDLFLLKREHQSHSSESRQRLYDEIFLLSPLSPLKTPQLLKAPTSYIQLCQCPERASTPPPSACPTTTRPSSSVERCQSCPRPLNRLRSKDSRSTVLLLTTFPSRLRMPTPSMPRSAWRDSLQRKRLLAI